uniref:Uncharacterized protein n=1 Tax=Aegilops tauschii TaxID=37682 RepID=M8B6E2_AEGTA
MALALLTPTGLLCLLATACSNPSSDVVWWEKEEEQACSLSTFSVHTARSTGLNYGLLRSYPSKRLDYSSSFTTQIRGTVGEVTPAGSASPPAIVWRRQGEWRLGSAALCMAVEVQHRHDVYGFFIFLISPCSQFYKLLCDAQWPCHALVRFKVQSSKSQFEVSFTVYGGDNARYLHLYHGTSPANKSLAAIYFQRV